MSTAVKVQAVEVQAVQVQVAESQLRVPAADARAALRAVAGQPAVAARARLRFGPGRTCEPVARLLDRAVVQAEQAGLDPARLVVAASSVQAAEDIVRVRRKAHGTADWIRSPTSRVLITLSAAVGDAGHSPLSAPAPAEASAAPTAPAEAGTAPAADAVREALAEVIDPDLGINIIDLGFVRDVAVHGRTATITMTLTSAACPLTRVMEDQIRSELAPLPAIDGFRVDWQWLPAWTPADITASGRDQLRAIGFTV